MVMDVLTLGSIPDAVPLSYDLAFGANRRLANTRNMKLQLNISNRIRLAFLLGCALLTPGTPAQAQVFAPVNNDLFATFRKVTPYTESYEVVADLGQAGTFLNQAAGTTVTLNAFTPAQLTNGSFLNLNNLSWSVFGAYSGSGYVGYTNNTLWLTVPRANNATPSTAPTRLGFSTQQQVKSKMGSIWSVSGGAGYVSQQLAVSNQFNTPVFVRESLSAYAGNNLATWMAGVNDPTQGTLSDTWPSTQPNSGNLENTTPAAFSASSVRSDLYEVRPAVNASGLAITDPHTGTTGLAYYVGYFEFFSTGVMTFTRATATSTAPAAVTLSITRNSTTHVNTISFPSASGVTYQLVYTSTAGLTTATANWTTVAGTISGDGTTKSFTDTTTDANRFYRVVEH